MLKNLFRSCFLAFFLASTVSVHAQTVVDAWVQMPDSVVPYLDKTARTECVDMYRIKSKLSVDNRLKGTSSIDTLTNDFLQAHVSNACMMQIKVLPKNNADSILCVIKTYAGPQKESTVTLYTRQWKRIRNITFCADSLLERPLTMTEDQFEQICKNVDHYFIQCDMHPQDTNVTVKINTEMTFMEEEKDFIAICKPKSYKWNGKTFE